MADTYTNEWGYYPAVSEWIRTTEAFIGDGEPQYRLRYVHHEDQCAGRVCIIHRPTDHHMRTWPLLWRDDAELWERIDKFGCGHPDPDQIPYWEETGQLHKTIHGCTGECHA